MATTISSCTCSYYITQQARRPSPNNISFSVVNVNSVSIRRRNICCSAVQESSTSTVDAAEAKEEAKKSSASDETDPTASEAPKTKAPPKPKAAAVAKPLPQLMEEDVIPSLQTTLEAEKDLSQLSLSFSDNKLEGSFVKKDIPYTFWAFFADGSINGPKGFSISSYGSAVSTVEPFLVDEKKPTAKHVVFWVQKRLAAQGIIPVWKDE